ncbi:MAG TPA: hypothetical protein PKA00_02505, partial [Saprospiraceae bacterium]|nr:hypothetical protein [Saprospiraceae bacterium]HMQ81744.1 hypothetical protein [Saprospiraceae bacterium]
YNCLTWEINPATPLGFFQCFIRFANLWDNYLSFNLYSDNISYLYVGLRPEIVPEFKLPFDAGKAKLSRCSQ